MPVALGALDFSVIAAYVFGLVLIFVVGKIFFWPLRLVMKLIYNAIIGGVMLWVFNLIGAHFGFTIALNPLTALVAGFLGLPGVVLLVLFKVFF